MRITMTTKNKKVSVLNELFGGQRRVAPDRDLEPRYTGKTLFSNRRAMPPVQRIGLVSFCLGLIVCLFLSLDAVGGDALFRAIARLVIRFLIVLCAFISVLGLFGIFPFQSRRLK